MERQKWVLFTLFFELKIFVLQFIIISTNYYECVCILALVIRHMNSVFAPYHIIICSFSGFNIFLTISHKRYNFLKKDTEYKICVLSEAFLSYEEFRIVLSCYVHRSSHKVAIILITFE